MDLKIILNDIELSYNYFKYLEYFCRIDNNSEIIIILFEKYFKTIFKLDLN